MGCKPNFAGWAALALLAMGPALAADGVSPAGAEVRRARASYRAGDHLAALAQAQAALALDSRNPAALELAAQFLHDSQGPVAALPLLERAVAARPRDVGLLGEYAATLGEAGRNSQMLAVVRRIVEIEPKNPRAFFLQAMLAARAGENELARRLLWLAGADNDPEPAAMWLDGVLAMRSGNPAQAADSFDALVRRQPDNFAAQVLLGRALLANGEANEVVAGLSPLADGGDASPYLLTLVGRAYEQLGERAAAARYLDRADRPLPTGAWAIRTDQALVKDPDGPLESTGTVARLRDLTRQGRLTEASALATRFAQRYPGSADVARAVGDVHLLAGRLDAALASYRLAATVRTDAVLVQRIAVLERLRGGEGNARALLIRRLRLNPRERSSAVLLAQLYAERGEWRSAVSLLDYAGRIGGSDPRLLADLARAHLALGEVAPALTAARAAHSLQRGNGGVAQALALARAAQGAPALARR